MKRRGYTIKHCGSDCITRTLSQDTIDLCWAIATNSPKYFRNAYEARVWAHKHQAVIPCGGSTWIEGPRGGGHGSVYGLSPNTRIALNA